MKLKTSLHVHTKEDAIDGYVIDYGINELIDYAAQLDFKVLALTGHRRFIFKKEYGEYAKEKGIILIPGIELSLNKLFIFESHIIILNCGKEAEKIRNWADLIEYKKTRPDIFIFAPHPGFGKIESASLKDLARYADIFDAIEHSWFYSKCVNLNKRVERLAKKLNKPFIATSDVHILDYFNTDYAIVDAKEFSVEAIFQAIREGKFLNITKPKSVFEMTWYVLRDLIKRMIKYSKKF